MTGITDLGKNCTVQVHFLQIMTCPIKNSFGDIILGQGTLRGVENIHLVSYSEMNILRPVAKKADVSYYTPRPHLLQLETVFQKSLKLG